LNGLDQLASEVQESANAAQDATCQYILFIHAYYHDDSDAMQRFFNTLQQLAKDGHAVSDDVIGVESADQMQSYINDVKNGVPTIEGGGSGVG
jgi:flagellar hook-associated protein FlgK